MEQGKRVELQLHTTESGDRRSVITPYQTVEAAVKLGYRAVAITDCGSVQGFWNAARAQRKYGDQIRLIYGTQVRSEDLVTLLAKDREGLQAMYRIISHMDNHYMVEDSVLQANREHLLLGNGGVESAISDAICEGASWQILTELASFYDYLTLFPTAGEAMNKTLYALGKELQIPVVAAGDCYCVEEEDRACLQVLEDLYPYTYSQDHPVHMRTTEQMLEEFSYLGEAAAFEVVVTNPNEIADRIADIDFLHNDFPAFSLPEAEETVRRLCCEKLEELYGGKVPEAMKNRLEEEISHLSSNASMFLLTHKLVKFLQEKGTVTGFRGTLGSTLLAYLLDVSLVNPMPAHYHCPVCRYTEFAEAVSGYDLPEKLCPVCGKPMMADGHNIPYETCLGPDGDRVVQIDINVPKSLQDAGIAFLADFWGKERVAFAGYASSHLRGKMQPAVEKCFPSLTEEEQDRMINKLVNVNRGAGQLSGGLTFLPEGMAWEDISPLVKAAFPLGGVDKMTHMDYHSVSDVLPKVDVFGYEVLDVLQELLDTTHTDLATISYTDPKVYALFEAQETAGIPEFSTDFTKGLLSRFQNLNFSDLVRISGMSHGTNVWTDNGENLVDSHDFRELIADRDDVYLTLRRYGVDRKTAFSAMEYTRKGRLQSDRWNTEALEQKLLDAGVPQWYVNSMKQVRYLFPKAHAVVYTKLAVTLAWFKVYKPESFYKVTLAKRELTPYLSCSREELTQKYLDLRGCSFRDFRTQDTIALLLEARRKNFA